MKATPRYFKEMAEASKKEFYYINDEWRNKKLLDIALELYYREEDPNKDTFDSCIDEAVALMNIFYDARYNPETRRR